MAALVFADSSARKQLEAILHPRIRALWRAQVASLQAAGHSCCVVVIPLLYETGAEEEFDTIICVACSGQTQQLRLLARGWSSEELYQRISAQWPVDRKLALAFDCFPVIEVTAIFQTRVRAIASFSNRHAFPEYCRMISAVDSGTPPAFVVITNKRMNIAS